MIIAGYVRIVCDGAQCGRELICKPSLVTGMPYATWNALGAVLRAEEQGWQVEGETARCPECIGKLLSNEEEVAKALFPIVTQLGLKVD